MAGVGFATDIEPATAADDFAVLAAGFDGGTDFHLFL